MTPGRLSICIPAGILAVLVIGCSSDSGDKDTPERTREADRQEIEKILDETAARWRYGDKAILYEQEFEYYQVENSYDDYLANDRIRRMESDTVETFVVKDIEFFAGDSARVAADVVFVGPTHDTTYYPQSWMMYYHQGHWIRPSLSGSAAQREFEELRRQAESAAYVEDEEDW